MLPQLQPWFSKTLEKLTRVRQLQGGELLSPESLTLTSLIVVQSLISIQDEVFQKIHKNTGFNNHTGLNI